MTRKEHLLTILSEECNEVGQRASKALRFSVQEIQPGQPLNNGDRVMEEFYDLVAVIEMLQDEEVLPNWTSPRLQAHITGKKERVEKFLLHSKENGTFDEEIAALKEKARRWDELNERVDKMYEEDSDADLVHVGEAAASAFGYLDY
jgi:hypothetical protein